MHTAARAQQRRPRHRPRSDLDFCINLLIFFIITTSFIKEEPALRF